MPENILSRRSLGEGGSPRCACWKKPDSVVPSLCPFGPSILKIRYQRLPRSRFNSFTTPNSSFYRSCREANSQNTLSVARILGPFPDRLHIWRLEIQSVTLVRFLI